MIEVPWQKWEQEQMDPSISSDLSPSQVCTASASVQHGNGKCAKRVIKAVLHLFHKNFMRVISTWWAILFLLGAFILVKW